MVREQGEPGFITVLDYEAYRPSHNEPAAMVAGPIFDNGTMIGILVLQISSNEIAQIMNSQQAWEKVGLGKTGRNLSCGSRFSDAVKYAIPPRKTGGLFPGAEEPRRAIRSD